MYRLDGLTPDEYATQRADRWQTAVALRSALAEGVRAARASAEGWRRLDTAAVAEAG